MRKVNGVRYLYRREDALYYRRAFPRRAQERLGQKEFVRSLGEVTVEVAKHLMCEKAAEFDRLTSSLPPEQQPAAVANAIRGLPSQENMEEAVRVWFADRMQRFRSGPAPASAEAATKLIEDLDALSSDASRSTPLMSVETPTSTRWIAEAISEANNWSLQPADRAFRSLLRLVAGGQIESARQIEREIEGKPRRIEDETFSPDQYRLDEERRRARPVVMQPRAMMSLFAGYIAEKRPAPATIKAWRPRIQAFVQFMGHDDATRITADDIIGWKEHLLTVPDKKGKVRGPKTVGEGYLAALKTVFNWAVDNRKLTFNPAQRIGVRQPKKLVTRERGLTDEEAYIILAATLQPHGGRLSEERRLARRWVPWICAYSGARVNEITQLRAEDVRRVRGIWTLTITPEAGPVKSGKMRTIAMHPHLIEQGFLAAIEGRSGPLFYNPQRYRGGSEGNPQAKKCGEHLASWVRQLGVSDPRVAPNHGWRHRFRTQSRSYRMDNEIVRVIQGHAARDESEDYGDTFAEAIGVDNSAAIPDEGLLTGPCSRILRDDGVDPRPDSTGCDVDIIVAGEFIEHIDQPIEFFRNMKARFPGRELVISTPNGSTFANTVLGMARREVQHPDHIHVFSYKILNTLCTRASLEDWKIIPYRFFATEMILQSRGAKRLAAQAVQAGIRIVERVFPLLSFGYIVHARL